MEINLTALARGDKQAWDIFVQQNTAIIYAAVRRTLGKYLPEHVTDEVVDIVQEVFIRLTGNHFKLIRQFDPERSSISTWLSVIAHSTTIDYLRRQRYVNQPLPENQLKPEQPAVPAANNEIEIPDDLLSDRQHLVLQLFFDRDMDVVEIAALLGISSQTVRSTRHKAIVKLRNHFGVDHSKNVSKNRGNQ